MLLKVDCLPNAVEKQPSMPLINLGRIMDVKLMMMLKMMMIILYLHDFELKQRKIA